MREATHSYFCPKVLGFLSVALHETMRYMRRQDEQSGDEIEIRRDFYVQQAITLPRKPGRMRRRSNA